MKDNGSAGLQLFSTCPQSKDVDRAEYLQRVADVARWSDEAGYRGILVYTDNGIADPWLVSQTILQNTKQLCPLIAIQPIYMHPYTAAKMVSTLAVLHDRRVYLNMLAGGFKNDLMALGDETPHDDRYVRTTEYTLIIKALLEGAEPVTLEGKYYSVKNLKLTPSLPPELFPGILISGSSDAGLRAAEAIGATAVKYPKPPGEEQPGEGVDAGVRVGVIARDEAIEAWRVALERFPEDRKGQIAHSLAMKVSDSQWHKQLSELGERPVSEENPYWLGPFQNYKTFCPYLVGTYDRVGEEIARYMSVGYSTFILDIPPSHEDIAHTARAFDAAKKLIAR
jgi:alkanesulfonate monooxygenase